MELFRIRKDIPFLKHAKIFNVISLMTFFLACFFLIQKGLHLSIEFTGGTVMEVAYKQAADLERIRGSLGKIGFTDMQVQSFGTAQDVLIRLPVQDGTNTAQVSDRVMGALKGIDEGVELKRVEYVGPQVGKELAHNGLMALGMLVIGIMIYLAIRFEWKFAVASIFANLHDVVIILGFFAFFQWEFSLTVLAAVLAVLGYSVNESVIVFDRVREAFRDRQIGKLPVVDVMNHAITKTVSRTLITHGSTQIMVLAMLIFGGPTLHYFAVALTIGICFGIYSSVFVAAAIAMWLGVRREDLLRATPEKSENDGAVV